MHLEDLSNLKTKSITNIENFYCSTDTSKEEGQVCVQLGYLTQLTCKLDVKDSADKNFYRLVDIGIPSKNGYTREDQRDTGSDP